MLPQSSHRSAWLACLLLVCGCDPAGRTPDSQPASRFAAKSAGDRDLAVLRSLPYAGGTEVAGDGETGVVAINREKMQRGYTLFTVFMKATAHVIDEDGRVVKTWSMPQARNWDNVELLPNGDLLTTGADPAPVEGIVDEKRFILRMSWNGEVLWQRYLPAHHDLTATPRGELLTLTFGRRRESEVEDEVDLRDDQITRLNPDGEVLQHLSLYDLCQAKPDLFPFEKVEPVVKGGRSWVDLFHCNSVEWMDRPELFNRPLYGPDNVLFCSRYQNRIAIVNMATPELLWAWGQGQLDGPHDAQVLANGNITVFDNGLARGWSRALELDPQTGEIVWQYPPADACPPEKSSPYHFFTLSKGSSQRLANGNTLICNADQGEMFEVTPPGEIVWHYVTPETIERAKGVLRATLVRAYRYDTQFIDDLFRRHGQPVPD